MNRERGSLSDIPYQANSLNNLRLPSTVLRHIGRASLFIHVVRRRMQCKGPEMRRRWESLDPGSVLIRRGEGALAKATKLGYYSLSGLGWDGVEGQSEGRMRRVARAGAGGTRPRPRAIFKMRNQE